MKLTEKNLKPIIEAKYLNVENTDRYRAIIRCFYLNYEKLKYWMYQEEVYEVLTSNDYFADYTMEQCQQDLTTLTDWKNLMAMQDTKKVSTIEEFKNRKFRYQLSEYAVEIERMVLKLENLLVEGASLEPTLLERIRINLSKIEEMAAKDVETVYSWWNDINNDFIRLNQNYQDYMRALNSVKAEEMMKTQGFLVFKNQLLEYLRSFVKGLQLNVAIIEQILKQMDAGILDTILKKVLEFELSIPRIDIEVSEEQLFEKIAGRYTSLREWFVEENGIEAEASKVFDKTNEIIRKITRYASQISELSNSGANRREEYYKVARMFFSCTDMEEAHKLSATVFGVAHTLHLKGDFKRDTESVNSGVFEEPPNEIQVTPRIRGYSEKAKRSPLVDRTHEKEEVKKQMLLQILKEQQLLNSYIADGCLDFSALPVIEPEVRNVFLLWLSKAFENKNKTAKTQDGKIYKIVEPEDRKKCVVRCTDGEFTMPCYKILFEED